MALAVRLLPETAVNNLISTQDQTESKLAQNTVNPCMRAPHHPHRGSSLRSPLWSYTHDSPTMNHIGTSALPKSIHQGCRWLVITGPRTRKEVITSILYTLLHWEKSAHEPWVLVLNWQRTYTHIMQVRGQLHSPTHGTMEI